MIRELSFKKVERNADDVGSGIWRWMIDEVSHGKGIGELPRKVDRFVWFGGELEQSGRGGEDIEVLTSGDLLARAISGPCGQEGLSRASLAAGIDQHLDTKFRAKQLRHIINERREGGGSEPCRDGMRGSCCRCRCGGTQAEDRALRIRTLGRTPPPCPSWPSPVIAIRHRDEKAT